MELQIKNRVTVGAGMVFAAATLLLFASSCTRDQLADGGISTKPDEAEVVMRLMTPGSYSSSGGTKGLSVKQENDIDEIYVLVFDKNNELSDIERGRDISTPGGGAFNVRTFTATFAASRTQSDTYNLIILANAASVLTATIGTDFGSFSGSKAFGDIWPLLTNTITEKMFASGGVIPMWSETGHIVVQAGASANVDLQLHRAVARIDVGVGTPVTAVADSHEYEWTNPTAIPFIIDEVYVFRPDNGYSLIPNPVNFTDKATAPTVPSSSTKFSIDDSQTKFKFSGVDITNGLYTNQSIYVPESDIRLGASGKSGDANHLERMAVVVGGRYNGAATTTYYRLDFVKNGALLDVLRNHLYQFNIKAVAGQGYPDPETAYNSLAMNMTVEILAWNDGEATDVVFNGQNYLSLRPGSEIEFSKEADTKTISVKTDVAEGWKISKITESDGTTQNTGWLTTDRSVGTLYLCNDAYMPVNISVSDNDSGNPRTGYIYLGTGSLTQMIKVTQGIATEIYLSITDMNGNFVDGIEFAAASGCDPGERIYKVKWSPKTETLYPSVSIVTNPAGVSYDALSWVYYNTVSGAINFSGTTVYTNAIDSRAGEAAFTIKPCPVTDGISGIDLTVDPFYERRTMVSFRLTGSEGAIRKDIILQQYVYNLVVEAGSSHLADGSSYSFNVKSNRPWKAYLIDDGGGMVASPAVSDATPFATGGYNLPDGTDISFRTVNDLENPTILSGSAKVRIDWDNGTGVDATQTVDLHCSSGIIQPKSNSYLVKPNSTPILIPVSRANDHADGAIGPTDKYDVELVWTDNANKIAPNSNIRLIQAAGAAGSGGYILVLPGSAEGNAVVAVKVGGEIKWSWHIWVTDFGLPDATSGAFLDRNLGATTNSNGLGSLGLLYQWGRKDPFPGSAALTNYTEPLIYDSLGEVSIKKSVVATTNNLNNAVAFPATFYYGVSMIYDWHTNQIGVITTQNDTLWGSSKTIYDPCPDGWKVPATGTAWSSLTGYTFLWSNYGRTNEEVGGWYPAAGFRNYSSGSLADVGSSGLYWTTSTSNTQGYSLFFSPTTANIVNSLFTQPRASGLSIRCVAE